MSQRARRSRVTAGACTTSRRAASVFRCFGVRYQESYWRTRSTAASKSTSPAKPQRLAHAKARVGQELEQGAGRANVVEQLEDMRVFEDAHVLAPPSRLPAGKDAIPISLILGVKRERYRPGARMPLVEGSVGCIALRTLTSRAPTNTVKGP